MKKQDTKVQDVFELKSRVVVKLAKFSFFNPNLTGTVAAISPEMAACFVDWDDHYPSQWIPMEQLRILLTN